MESRKRNPFRSIKAKLLIFILCISLIPISVDATVNYLNARRTIKKETMEWMTAVAEAKKAQVLEFLEAKKGRTVDFSSDGFIRDGLETIDMDEDAAAALNTHLTRNKRPVDPYILRIDVVDIDGRVAASTHEAVIGQNMLVEDVGHAEVVDKGYAETYFGQPHFMLHLDTNSLDIVAPLSSRESGNPIGAIVVHYDMCFLNDITGSRAGMGETGEVVLGQRVGDDIKFLNTLRYAPDAPLNPSVPLEIAQAAPMRLALEGRSGAAIAQDYRGVDVVAAYQEIPLMGWGLVAKIDAAEAFAPLRTLGLYALIIWLVTAAVAAGVGVVFAFSTARPINRLRDAAIAFARGNRKQRVEIRRRDEIGELASSFNQMADDLSREITDHERAEAEMRQQRDRLAKLTAELGASNRELEAFCYSVSHDLRAPLRSVDGFTRALEEDYGDRLDETAKSYIGRVRAASLRMSQLIEDLLALSRITRGEMRRERINLSAAAREIADELKKAEPDRRVEFVIADGLVADGDGRLVRVALENLMGNAWKFTRKQEDARIEFGVTEHEGKKAYFVRDNGAGFDMSYADKLFGVFQRLHSTKDFEGTGVGLATAQRVIHRHGGEIWAEGTVGKGATFYFTLGDGRTLEGEA